MPGIAGCISLKAGVPQPEEVFSRLTQPLMLEKRYTVERIPCAAECAAVLVNPEIDEMICGIAQDAIAEVSLGFYGEFYDSTFQAATKGSQVAEILLQRYLEAGDSLPQQLDGSFVVFIADRRRGKYMLFNDYYASRPAYYGTQGSNFYFSPEAKGVARMPGFDASVDEDAMMSFLACSSPVGEHTFFKHVKPLMPGTLLTIEGGRLARTQSSVYAPCADTVDRGEEYYSEGLAALLMKSVAKQLRNPEKAFIPLSGGIDSRMIAGCANKITGGGLHTVSWGVDETRPDSDTVVGRQVAEFLHASHHFARRESEHLQRDIAEMIYRMDGQNTDPASHSNELCIMRRIREEFGGLYVLRGEEWFGHASVPTCDAEAMGQWGIAPLGDHLRIESILNPAKLPQLRDHSARIIQQLLESCPSADLTDRRDYFYFTVRQFHYHSRSAYCKRSIVDVRNPWLDKELTDFLKTLPVRYRIDRYLYRKTATRMFPELMALPVATRNSLENWSEVLQKDLAIQSFLKKHLIENRNSFHELLNPDAVRNLYQQAIQPGGARSSLKQRAMKTTKDYLRKQTPQLYRLLKPSLMGKIKTKELPAQELLFRLLILKIWFDEFVDGQAQPQDWHR